MFFACKSGKLDIVKYLSEHGAAVNIENRRGITPLFYAYERKNEDLVKYLSEHGAE